MRRFNGNLRDFVKLNKKSRMLNIILFGAITAIGIVGLIVSFLEVWIK